MTTANKAVFLDRDGVINEDRGYVHKIKDFVFLDGVFSACRHLQMRGYMLIVVTNQSGIGRDYFSEAQFHQLTTWMLQQFKQQHVHIAAVKYCPEHPERASAYRKPGPQMLLDAAMEYALDMSASVMIGDKESDVQAAQAAGVSKILLLQANPAAHIVPGVASYRDWPSLMAAEFL